MRRVWGRVSISAVGLLLCVPATIRAQAVCPTVWQLDEVLRIGSPESTELITNIRDLVIGPDSALYVAQAMVPAVTVFSLDGRVLRRIGRAGQGPGDIQYAAYAVGWIGDTLWIADDSRIQLFTNDKREPDQVVRFSLAVPDEGARLTPGRVLADGTLIGKRSITDMAAYFTQGASRGIALHRLSRSGEILDTISVTDWSGNAVEYGGNRAVIHPLRDFPPIGLNEYLTAIRSDGSAVVQVGGVQENGAPPTFDIMVISIRGDTLLRRAVEYEPHEVTSAMERRLADELAGWVAGDYASRSALMPLLEETTLDRRRRAVRRAFWVPRYHPPVRQVVAGTDGTIWLLREMRDDRIDVWEVYNSDGTLEGTLEVGQGRSSYKPWSPRIGIVLASRDEVWGATFDENDVPYLHRYRIDRTCAP